MDRRRPPSLPPVLHDDEKRDHQSMTFQNFNWAEVEDLIKKMKSIIIPRKAIDETAFLDEFFTSSVSPLTFQLQADRPCLVNNITVAYTPIGAGTLAIGDRMITLTSGADSPIQIGGPMIVYPKDTIVLTVGGATLLFVEIMGYPLAGTDWSRI